MATATLQNTPTTASTVISTAETTTGWTGTGVALDNEIYKQGSNSVSSIIQAQSNKNYLYYTISSTDLTNAHVCMWWQNTAYGKLDDSPTTGGPLDISIGDGTNTNYYTVRQGVGGTHGVPEYEGGWTLLVVDLARTPDEDNSASLTAVTQVGVRVQFTDSPRNVINNWLDNLYYIPASTPVYDVYGGTSGDEIDWKAIASADASGGWGLVQSDNGIYRLTGPIQIGDNTSTNATWFSDSSVLIPANGPVGSDYYVLSVDGNTTGTTDFDTDLASILSDANTVDFDLDQANVNDLDIESTAFSNQGTFNFKAGQSITSSTFNSCGAIALATASFTGNTLNSCAQITTTGSDMRGSSVLTSTAAADTGALYWNAAYTDTYLDDMTFSKGTNAHHAIDFGTSVTSNLTLRNCEFTGFGSTDDANDSTVRFLATSGSLTLSLVGCTVDGAAATANNFSVDDSAGVSVTVSYDPVTTLVHVTDNDGNDEPLVNVYLRAANGDGDLPFEDTVTITRAGTIATVVHSGHGMYTSEYIKITGITDNVWDNYGAHQITVSDSGAYTYVTVDSGSTSYTGTIKATGVTIYGVTDSGGDISSSRTYALDQDLTGYARKSSTPPIFKTASLTGTVDASAGLTINTQLISDE